jgi:hypothetical protein
MLTNTQRRKLQNLIDRTVRHGSAYYRAQTELNEFARELYGVEPGDVDADDIIDGIFGGCGEPTAMSADEFDITMRSLTQ